MTLCRGDDVTSSGSSQVQVSNDVWYGVLIALRNIGPFLTRYSAVRIGNSGTPENTTYSIVLCIVAQSY